MKRSERGSSERIEKDGDRVWILLDPLE